MRSIDPWLGPAEKYGPSDRFWRPANRWGQLPFAATRKLAERLSPLNRYQKRLVRRARLRPWDPYWQAQIQNALQRSLEVPLFPPLPCETAESIRDLSKLAGKYQVFVPSDLPVPAAAREVLEKKFLLRGYSGNIACYVAQFDKHEIWCSITGWGKTVAAQNRFLQAKDDGRWALILAKPEEWTPMLPELARQGVRPAMPRTLKLNPLAPYGNPLKWKEFVVERFRETKNLPSYSGDAFDMLYDDELHKYGAYDKSDPLEVNPTPGGLLAKLEKHGSSRFPAGVINTLVVGLRAWERLFGNWAVPWNVDELSRRTILFSFADLNTTSSRSVAETLQGGVFAIREGRLTRERLLILIEEARLLYAGASRLRMAEDIALLRGEGISVCAIVQSTRDLHPVLLENTAIRALGPVGHPAITAQMSAAMGLQPGHIEALQCAPIGTFIEKYLYGFSGPLLVRPVYRPMRPATPEEIDAAEHALDNLPCKTHEEAHRIDLGTCPSTTDPSGLLPAETLDFLQGIYDYPRLTTVERFAHHGLNPRKGSVLKKRCLARDYVEERRVALGVGGSPSLLQLTAKAQTLLKLPRIKRQVVHSYSKHRIVECCQRFGVRARVEVDGVDVLVTVGKETIAIEVEVSGTNAEANLQRDLRYDRIVFVAVGAATLNRVRRRLAPVVRKLDVQDRVVFVSLGQFLKSDSPISLLGVKSVDPISR